MIETIKGWITKKPQFEMIKMRDGSYWACRLKDGEFFNVGSLGRVIYKGRNAKILEFSYDSINVLLEQKKKTAVVIDEEFDPANYDFIWVPINNIELREIYTH